MSPKTIFGVQFDALEPVDVFTIVEHVADNGRIFVHLKSVTTENDSLYDQSIGVHRENSASSNNFL